MKTRFPSPEYCLSILFTFFIQNSKFQPRFQRSLHTTICIFLSDFVHSKSYIDTRFLMKKRGRGFQMALFNWPDLKKSKENEEVGVLFSAVRESSSRIGDDEVKKITGFAGLLGKVAYADMDISSPELEKIRRVMVHVLKLDTPTVETLIDLMTEHRVQLFSIEDHLYARMINEVCTMDQKRLLLEALFSLAAADESISNAEDAAIWTVAKSLRFSHGDFIAARKRYRAHLDILKKPAD